MWHRDYILRMMAHFGQVLARMIGLKEVKQYQDALLLTDETFKQLFGFGSKFITTISTEDLLAMLKPGGVLDAEACIMMATLLKAEGEVYEEQQEDTEAIRRYYKSLQLLLEAYSVAQSTELAEYYDQIPELVQKLDEYELPTSAKIHLFHYYETTGQYAQAEDVLFDLLENNPDPALFERGEQFYRRLQAKTDNALRAGNLTRHEVDEGLAGLQEMERQE